MGSYCELRIANYYVDSFKRHIPPELAIIFRDSDLKMVDAPKDEVDSAISDDEEGGATTRYELVMTAAVAKDRLNLLGFTEASVAQYFADGIAEEIQDACDLLDFSGSVMENYYDDEIALLKGMQSNGLERWREAISCLILDSLRDSNLKDQDGKWSLPHEYSIYKVYQDRRDSYLGFPGRDLGMFLRAALEQIPTETNVVLDITELMIGGYYQSDEPICTGIVDEILSEARPFNKIIILTEGKSDSRIFEMALRILYPHLYDYFSFMDFGLSKVEGSASALVTTIKSFAGAGINNKIIALFDNDAAGVEHWKIINDVTLPSNIKPIKLPYNHLASNYPTIGPQGSIEMDVNGRAASTELYLGETLLKNSKDQLMPIQWSSWNYKICDYQGAIIEKASVQERFENAMKAIESGAKTTSDFDFTELHRVFDMIFKEASTL